jgi:hypothetical protein
MQVKMINFIQQNGGNATYYQESKITSRPDWADIEQFLKKEITLAELKARMGC